MAMGDLHGGDDLPHDVPLILKASCDERVKRIRFVPNVQQLCFREFHTRIGHALQFDSVDFSVTWQDDDGEHCEITNDDDLKEALLYFAPAACALGEGTTADTQRQPISMRVNVRVETAISLSDFGGSSVWGDSDESDEDQWSVGDDGSEGVSNKSDSSSRIRLSHASGSGSTTSSTRLKNSTLGNDWARSRRTFNSRINSNGSSSQAAESNGLSSLRSLSLQSSPRDARLTSSSSSSGSDDSMNTRAPRAKRPIRSTRPAEEPNGFNVHHDVECNACRIKPIVGIRYHCASCVKGANFCGDCERTGNAVRRSTHHNESHIMVKLASPLQNADMADMLRNTLHVTLERLMSQSVMVSSASTSSSSSSSSGHATTREVALVSPLGASVTTLTTAPTVTTTEVRCSFCTGPFSSGVRYLCANCPIIGSDTRDGYNLCATCEVHSLKIHDPAHFFLKLSTFTLAAPSYNTGAGPRIPLGDRWDVQEMLNDSGGGSLLPCLYSGLESFDPLLPPGVIPRPSQHNTPVRTPDGVQMAHQQQQQNDAALLQEEDETLDDGETHSRARWLAPWSSRTRDIRLHSLREARSRTIIPLENLVHPSILCDNCFHVIHGAWYRCVHCTSSYDLCTTCMSRIAHDSTHAFAVFKQPVDLDLFKSCVDHQDVGERQGSSRPMLPFALT